MKAHSGDRTKPRAKWAYAWRVRIINLSISQPGIRHIKPFIVYICPAENGLFKANCAESLGKTICRDFGLKINETLWLEYFPASSEKIYTAAFTPKSAYSPEFFFSISWRPAHSNETAVIEPFIPEIACLKKSETV